MKLTLLDRHIKTLENYLSSKLRNRFYQDDFLKGISQQRAIVLDRQARSMGVVFFLSVLLIASEASTGAISFGGVTIPLGDAVRTPLTLMLSLTIFGTVLATLDQIIIERYIDTIGMASNLYSFQIVIANYTARNLWSNPLTPKYFGLMSRRSHKYAFGIWGIVILLIMIFTFFIPAAVVISSSIRTLTTVGGVFADIVAVGNLFILAASFAFLIFITQIKFEFDPAHFDEVDGKPTKEFLETLSEKDEKSGS
jgi:hypothetical protein